MTAGISSGGASTPKPPQQEITEIKNNANALAPSQAKWYNVSGLGTAIGMRLWYLFSSRDEYAEAIAKKIIDKELPEQGLRWYRSKIQKLVGDKLEAQLNPTKTNLALDLNNLCQVIKQVNSSLAYTNDQTRRNALAAIITTLGKLAPDAPTTLVAGQVSPTPPAPAAAVATVAAAAIRAPALTPEEPLADAEKFLEFVPEDLPSDKLAILERIRLAREQINESQADAKTVSNGAKRAKSISEEASALKKAAISKANENLAQAKAILGKNLGYWIEGFATTKAGLLREINEQQGQFNNPATLQPTNISRAFSLLAEANALASSASKYYLLKLESAATALGEIPEEFSTAKARIQTDLAEVRASLRDPGNFSVAMRTKLETIGSNVRMLKSLSELLDTYKPREPQTLNSTIKKNYANDLPANLQKDLRETTDLNSLLRKKYNTFSVRSVFRKIDETILKFHETDRAISDFINTLLTSARTLPGNAPLLTELTRLQAEITKIRESLPRMKSPEEVEGAISHLTELESRATEVGKEILMRQAEAMRNAEAAALAKAAEIERFTREKEAALERCDSAITAATPVGVPTVHLQEQRTSFRATNPDAPDFSEKLGAFKASLAAVEAATLARREAIDEGKRALDEALRLAEAFHPSFSRAQASLVQDSFRSEVARIRVPLNRTPPGEGIEEVLKEAKNLLLNARNIHGLSHRFADISGRASVVGIVTDGLNAKKLRLERHLPLTSKFYENYTKLNEEVVLYVSHVGRQESTVRRSAAASPS